MVDDGRATELLEQLLSLTAASVVQGKSLSEGAPLLDRLGVDRGVIAAVYGTSEASVRAIVSQAKSKKGKK